MADTEKRGYTLSPAALAQRKGAPWLHGIYASSVLAQVMPPCILSKCPLGQEAFPCDVRQAADATGHKLERCPVVLGENGEAITELARAILDGDIQHLAQGAALSIRLAHNVLDRGLVEILREGLTIEEPVLFEGEVVPDVVKHHTHPSAKPVIELLQVLGLSADAQQITPKSRGDSRLKEAFRTLADRTAEARRALEPSSP